MTVVFDRPYEFVPPLRSTIWPWLIQRLRLVDHYLAKKEGVVGYECRGLERCQKSLDAGHGIVLAPNHCRYADPLVMGWPTRELNVYVYAMASWHLFNTGWFDTFAMRRCGGFSLHREGADRASLETAIDSLATAERPLVLFPEGTTYQTNDWVREPMDGVTFIARAAARRRAKKKLGQVVIHPVGLKYICQDDITAWADAQLTDLEQRFRWQKDLPGDIVSRLLNLSEATLCVQEVRFFGSARSGDRDQRRVALSQQILQTVEKDLQLSPDANDTVRERTRDIRGKIASEYFDQPESSDERKRLRDADAATDIAHWFDSYSDDYFAGDDVTDARIVETIQRFQEFLIGKVNRKCRLKVVVEVDEAIEVPAAKAPRGEPDPLTATLHEKLSALITRLSKESKPFSG